MATQTIPLGGWNSGSSRFELSGRVVSELLDPNAVGNRINFSFISVSRLATQPETGSFDDLSMEWETNGFGLITIGNNHVAAFESDEDATEPYGIRDRDHASRTVTLAELFTYAASASASDRSGTLLLDDGAAGGPITVGTNDTRKRRSHDMYLANPRRDARFMDFDRANHGLGNAHAANNGDTGVVARLHLTVHEVEATLRMNATVTVTNNQAMATGIMLIGPDEVGPGHTLYRVLGHISTSKSLHGELGVGIAPASPAATGRQSIVRFTPVRGAEGGLDLDELVAVPPFGTISSVSYAKRAVCFLVRVGNYTGATVSGAVMHAQISVQRLVGAPPGIVDRRIG